MYSIDSMLHRVVLLICMSFAFPAGAHAQGGTALHLARPYVDSVIVAPRDSIFHLTRQFIISGSASVSLDARELTEKNDYILDARRGVVRLRTSILDSLVTDTSRVHKMVVRYNALPFSFESWYRHREPVYRTDSASGERLKIARPTKPFSVDDLFGTRLQKSGSIVRGFTVGSNRDLSLSSGFRMQMSGNLTDDLEIVAALTDENTPIQPEGTTLTLQEIDKVFVELRGKNVKATLGDFNFELEGSEFGKLHRKLQGAQGAVSVRGADAGGELMLVGAVARGKYVSNRFTGIEGVQGPYRLTGQNGERGFIVIAGSERVFVNGEMMTRGELADYTIDYSIGEVKFTTRRLITNHSRLTVDFEYSDRQYSRNFLAGRSSATFLNDALKLSTTVAREGDDENSPIDASLTPADLDSLERAGDNPLRATRPAVVYVGPGKGQYLIDTIAYHSPTGVLITKAIYKFNPADTIRAVYVISFSYVGDGKGEYRRITLQQYAFDTTGRGSYTPVRYLSAPQSKSIVDFDLKGKVGSDLDVSGEYAISDYDANRLSSLDDDDNVGNAAKLGIHYAPQSLVIGGSRLGRLDVRLSGRFIGRRFAALDRFNEIEFARKWNLFDSTAADEEIREGEVKYEPIDALLLHAGLGAIRRGDPFSSDRTTAGVSVHPASLPNLIYNIEIIKSRSTAIDNEARWTRHSGQLADTVGGILPSFRFGGEVLRSRSLATDTLRRESFRFYEAAPRVVVPLAELMSFTGELGWRWDDSLKDGVLNRFANSFTQQYAWQVRQWNSITSSFDVTLRDRHFLESTGSTTEDRSHSTLIRSQTRVTPLDRGIESDLYYEVATERSAKLERVFTPVPFGTGNYVYGGDLNGNRIVDQDDFQLTRFNGDYVALVIPGDELVPVVDLKASVRFRLNGSRLLSATSPLGGLLSQVSTETYFRVEERSTSPETRDVYLLHLGTFLNERTTLLGSNLFSQELYVRENDPEFSVRLRFHQRLGLTQYSAQLERAFVRERSIRLRWQLIKELANQVDFHEKIDILSASLTSSRERQVRSQLLIIDWSYRPASDVELGFKFGVGRSSNFKSASADLNEQTVRFTYEFAGRGQLRAEWSREEVLLSDATSAVPYELTNGRVAGKTWLWNFSFDYRLTRFIQSTIAYDGRSEGGRSIVHTAKAEVRAFF